MGVVSYHDEMESVPVSGKNYNVVKNDSDCDDVAKENVYELNFDKELKEMPELA